MSKDFRLYSRFLFPNINFKNISDILSIDTFSSVILNSVYNSVKQNKHPCHLCGRTRVIFLPLFERCLHQTPSLNFQQQRKLDCGSPHRVLALLHQSSVSPSARTPVSLNVSLETADKSESPQVTELLRLNRDKDSCIIIPASSITLCEEVGSLLSIAAVTRAQCISSKIQSVQKGSDWEALLTASQVRSWCLLMSSANEEFLPDELGNLLSEPRHRTHKVLVLQCWADHCLLELWSMVFIWKNFSTKNSWQCPADWHIGPSLTPGTGRTSAGWCPHALALHTA